MLTKEPDAFELFTNAMEAYALVPKEAMERTWNEDPDTITLSCPSCGVIFAVIPTERSYFSSREPLFCCGKLMI